MNLAARKRVVVLGMMTKTPVAGVIWQTLQYLLGLERLGYDAHYVEAHARTPSMLMERETDDSSTLAAGLIDSVLRGFGLGGRWAFHALHQDGGVYGMSERELERLYRSAALIINLHGGTEPLPAHARTGRLVYLETDPVQLQVELEQDLRQTIDFLEPHVAFFTFAENYGKESCPLPVFDRFPFRPTRQPVAPELWFGGKGGGDTFTTIGNWRQRWRDVRFQGGRYTWSKDVEFGKFLDLPGRAGARFELALASYEPRDQEMLEAKGWQVRDALGFSKDLEAYRTYITGSRGEFTVAKDQNVRLRTGWFSDRSATYLAAGRPVVTQETGFSDNLPTGAGLFGVSDLDEAVEAISRIEADYEGQRQAAFAIAREYFDAQAVLGQLLEEVGLGVSPNAVPASIAEPFGAGLDLTVVSRRPTTLSPDTVASVVARPIPVPVDARRSERPFASVVVVTREGLTFTRLCLESVLANTVETDLELIVVDNGSRDGTPEYLATLAADERVRVILNEVNLGFAPAVNQGLRAARGEVLVLLNADTLVPPGWLEPLLQPLTDPAVGLVGPVTNEAGNEAEVEIGYRSYGELVHFARQRARTYAGRTFPIEVATMFCAAFRRDVYDAVGPLDERFEIGFFEDDDYSMRVLVAGFRVVCAESAFVHHFGEGSFGPLVPTGEHGRIFRENQRRFEEKWLTRWESHERRPAQHYRTLVERVRRVVSTDLPADAVVLVVSKGDEKLVELDGRTGWHFPRLEDGSYAGHYPGTSEEAIAQFEALRTNGARYVVFPETSRWWLDWYDGLADYLSRFEQVDVHGACQIFCLEDQTASAQRLDPAQGAANAVCVVGMHRSGTSMVAAALSAAGVHLGGREAMQSPTPENPRGFWEHRRFVELNDLLLTTLGGSWDLPPPLPESWPRDPRLEPLRRDAEALLATFAGRKLWGWKDPRNSLTLPFWRGLVNDDLRIVVCLRHPLEVAASLAQRNGHTRALAFRLWSSYNRAIVENSTPGERLVTHYSSYFPDACPEISRLLRLLHIDPADEVVERCAAMIAPDLRHHREDVVQADCLPPAVAELYETLAAEAAVLDSGREGRRETAAVDSPPEMLQAR